MKLRSIDYIMIFSCALAAGLCYAGSNWSAPMFILSSSIGLVDSTRNKVLTGAIINGIFLALNVAVFVQNVR
jgi:hypothetical protein